MPIVYTGKLFTIEQETRKNGKIRETCYRTPSVGIIAFTAEHQLVLIKEKIGDSYIWGLPWGKVDPEETPKDAAYRELEEESGYKADELVLFTKNYLSKTLQFPQYVYIAKDLTKTSQILLEDEDITVEIISLDKAEELIFNEEFRHDFAALSVLKMIHRIKTTGTNEFFNELFNK